jgi:hypothetical protein
VFALVIIAPLAAIKLISEPDLIFPATVKAAVPELNESPDASVIDPDDATNGTLPAVSVLTFNVFAATPSANKD